MSSTRLPMHGRNHRPKGWYGPDDPGGSDPLNWMNRAGGLTLEQLVMGATPTGFWKFNEPSGTTAHDSSGNDRHLEVVAGSPNWGQPAMGPGEICVEIPRSSPATRLEGDTGAKLFPYPGTADFMVDLWVKRLDTDLHYLVGQGDLSAGGSGGWGLGIAHANSSTPGHVGVTARQSVNSVTGIVSDAAIAVGEEVYVAVTRTSGLWQMYVNGILQADTMTQSIGNPSSAPLWFGGNASDNGGYFHASYLSIIVGRALTGPEIGARYQAGTGPSLGRTVTANYTIDTATDRFIFADGTLTVTLPTAVGNAGWYVTVKNVGSGTVTVARPTGELIDGAASNTSISTTQQARTFTSDGFGWKITGGYL
jgi:hypothetical protein